MEIAIVVPVHNRKAYISSLLTQIEQQQQQLRDSVCLRTIVVDDGSTDGTAELIQQKFPGVLLVKGNGSLWWTGAIVKGMEYAVEACNPDFFLWLNDDITLDDSFLKNLIKVCRQPQSDCQITGGIVRDQTYQTWIVYSGQRSGKPICKAGEFEGSAAMPADAIAGNITLIPQKIVIQVGLPDSVRFPHHGGDYTYTKRVKQAGFRLIIDSSLQATTDYRLTDLIRYMPYWMQWRLAQSAKERFNIIRGLTSLKANQNIWLFVHLQKSGTSILPWDYVLCYVSKLAKLAVVSTMREEKFFTQLKSYLEAWSSPMELWAGHPLFEKWMRSYL